MPFLLLLFLSLANFFSLSHVISHFPLFEVAFLVSFTSQKELPKYQIYTHNCDTVARELIALIDLDMKEFNATKERLTPSGNFEQMCRFLGEKWGCMPLGTDTLIEKILWNF